MENRINYMMLGIFVIGLSIGTMWFILWMGKYSENESYLYYKVNTNESVSGLNNKAPVKYRGVVVGEASDIFINPDNSEEVSIVIKIKQGTPIKKDTYALIEPQGITGLSYLQLEGGSHEAPLLGTATNKKDHRLMSVLRTKPSLFSRVDKSITKIAHKTDNVLTSTNVVMQKAQKILSDKNLENLEMILENSAKLSKSIQKTAKSLEMQGERVEHIMNQALELEHSAIKAANQMREMSNTISGIVESTGVDTMDKMSVAAESVRVLMKKIEDKFDSGMFDIDSITKDALTPAESTLDELENLMIQTQELLEKFENSPSDIIFKSTSQEAGPGERK